MATYRSKSTDEQVAAAVALPPRAACQACYRGWPPMTSVVIDRYGSVTACADPAACRQHAIKVGLYKITRPIGWPIV